MAWTALLVLGLCGQSAVARQATLAHATLPSPAPASVTIPETRAPAAPEAWTTNVAVQLSRMLRSSSAARRAEAMQLAILLPQRFPEVNFDPVVPELLRIYEWDTDKAHRLMAVSALHAIGNEASLDQLNRLAEREPSLLVRRVTRAAVADRRHAP